MTATITRFEPMLTDALGGAVGTESDRWTLTRCGPEDASALAAMYVSMSEVSRRLRFFQSMPRVSPSMVRRLCEVDQVRHRAWLARPIDDHRVVVGEVRGVIDPDAGGEVLEAEIAVAVRDDWAGRGLGRAMVRHVMADLASAGVTEARCEVLAENRRSLGLFQSLGFRFGFGGGVMVGRAPIDPLVPNRR